MANDTYAIVHYDATAHATQYAALISAGATLVGAGILNSAAAYFAEGILDGGTRYGTGIFDGTTRHLDGIFDGVTTRYADGIWSAEGAASWVKTTMDAAEVSDLVDAAILAYDRRAPYDAGNATGDVTLDTVNGSKQKVTLTGATAARLILPPTGGAEGDYVIIRVTDGGTSPRTLGFDPAIQIPSEYYGTLPKPLGTGLSYKVRLEYDGANWELQTLVGGL